MNAPAFDAHTRSTADRHEVQTDEAIDLVGSNVELPFVAEIELRDPTALELLLVLIDRLDVCVVGQRSVGQGGLAGRGDSFVQLARLQDLRRLQEPLPLRIAERGRGLRRCDRLLACDRRRSEQEQDERQGGGWMHPHLPGANASLIPALSANSMNRVTSPFRSVKIITQSVSNDRPVGFARPT